MATELILITGASSDIGIALSRCLLAAPGSVHILAHYNRTGTALDEIQRDFPGRVTPLQADFTKASAVAAMLSRMETDSLIPSSVVHLPALKLQYVRFPKLDWAQFQQDMSIQLYSVATLLQRFLPKMVRLERAKVVFVLSSVVHGMPPKFMSSYTIVKYAQLGLMRALASEYASTTMNINAVSPGMVETQFLSDIPELSVQMSAANHPRGRNATPADIVGAIQFLLSPACDYMSGADIPVTGGSVC